MTDEKCLILPRKQMLVVTAGEDIVYVPGSRISEKYKVTEASQNILKIELTLL